MTAKKTDAEILEILQRPFDPSLVKQKGRYAYISHGLITQRLTEADPHWGSHMRDIHTYTDERGVLHCAGVTIYLTLHFPERGEVTRMESGGPQRQESFGLEIKNAQSDALKRAAMRFGVALEMWESLVDAEGDEDYFPTPKRMPQRDEVNGRPNPPPTASVNAGLTKDQHAAIERLAQEIGDDIWLSDQLVKHGATAINGLTIRGASSVIGVLQRRANELRKERATVS